ncbi:uncharacterized protein LOC132918476 [Rhopalosiphum padi]|uniref:uncharacterized protein LOC132918476 n=1 Tax=Rhopalosiphum padi TaxID=40932 RepID=UPI00298DE46D|nr:uncharacterized protein LOC132918476 [Rhopalosiphum padi]
MICTSTFGVQRRSCTSTHTALVIFCARITTYNITITSNCCCFYYCYYFHRHCRRVQLCLADELQNLSHADSGQKMEALLEERIQLLQERMKAITAQREQIEEANRGLEEELNKLSKNFVKITNNVKVTDETEEEKTN